MREPYVDMQFNDDFTTLKVTLVNGVRFAVFFTEDKYDDLAKDLFMAARYVKDATDAIKNMSPEQRFAQSEEIEKLGKAFDEAFNSGEK